MIIIDTAFHITFSSTTENPKWACISKCKKAWWDEDFKQKIMGSCPMCDGIVTAAVKDVHFKIIQKENRNFQVDEIIKFDEKKEINKQELDQMLKKGGQIVHMSKVKDKFIEKAIKEWNANNMKYSISIE